LGAVHRHMHTYQTVLLRLRVGRCGQLRLLVEVWRLLLAQLLLNLQLPLLHLLLLRAQLLF